MSKKTVLLSHSPNAIEIHLWDINTRNGWNLDDSRPAGWCDRWAPWILGAVTMIVIIVVKWFNL